MDVKPDHENSERFRMVALAMAVRDDSDSAVSIKKRNFVSSKKRDLAEARKRLIVPLDFDTIREAERLVDVLGDEVVFYKVGLGLQLLGGDQFARKLKRTNKHVFLDYKYYDIDKTIENAVRRAAEFGIDFLTVHGVSHLFKSAIKGRDAIKGRGASALKLFCVTVLTSMDTKDLEEMGYPPNTNVQDLVVHRAKAALEAGLDGVIASGAEAAKIKGVTGGRLLVVSPGIRPDGSPVDDQKRVMTPEEAIKSGADYLVIGRPIIQASDPKAQARKIVNEIAKALSSCELPWRKAGFHFRTTIAQAGSAFPRVQGQFNLDGIGRFL